jgi:crotonobetainyl-CoA:carnitine CoA-transferase CaiB-like acyl-CoA transferase
MTVKIAREDNTAQDLRVAAGSVKDGKVARRLLAIALVLDGASRKTASESCGMDRQTLRDHCPAGYAQHAREEGYTATTPKALTGWPVGVVVG